MNVLLVRGLMNLHTFYGDAFTVEYPTGSGVGMTLFEVAEEISRRLTRIFLGDNGAGLGASHQTGWTGLVAPLIHLFGWMDAEALLQTFHTTERARQR